MIDDNYSSDWKLYNIIGWTNRLNTASQKCILQIKKL